MEGGRDGDVTGAAAPQGRYYGRRGGGGGGGSGDESDGSSSCVELSLRLTTGSSPPASAGQQGAAARRSMTIFYGGRVCAVDVTEVQAREIISMANKEILADQWQQLQQHREDRHVQDRGSSSSATAMCGGQVIRPGATVSPAAGCPRQGLATMAAPVTDQAGLSMKRSLQRFLQKREARRAAAVAPPYATAGRQAQAMRH